MTKKLQMYMKNNMNVKNVKEYVKKANICLKVVK